MYVCIDDDADDDDVADDVVLCMIYVCITGVLAARNLLLLFLAWILQLPKASGNLGGTSPLRNSSMVMC